MRARGNYSKQIVSRSRRARVLENLDNRIAALSLHDRCQSIPDERGAHLKTDTEFVVREDGERFQ